MPGTVEQGSPPDRTRTTLTRAGVAVFVLACAACAVPGPKATNIVTDLRIPPVVVDRDTVLDFSLSESGGQSVLAPSLSVEAHMTHPGMAPVIEPAVSHGGGKYTVTVRFTMAGEWVLYVKGDLADRRRIDQLLGKLTVAPAS